MKKKTESWEIRSHRSLESRMGIILYAVRNLKRCVIQVQNMLPSGASDQDIVSINFISIFYLFLLVFMYLIMFFNCKNICRWKTQKIY